MKRLGKLHFYPLGNFANRFFSFSGLSLPCAHAAKTPLAATISGDEGDRTLNPCLAKAVLSQLSYVPKPQLCSARHKIRTCDLVVISDAL